MRFLDWNQRKVRNLSPWEIWGFIAGRVLMSFGLGVLAMKHYPETVDRVGVPTLVVGLILLAFAAKGLARKETAKEHT